uniref:Retrotransposon Copia-like N-terminal domain-containing protein n=1 Tax=Cucumis melo TaxID=3656 RepID=A0A9I9EGN4_CUCME
MGALSSYSSSPSSVKDLSSPLFLLTNIGNLISIRLGLTNYTLWIFQFILMLKARKLLDYIDGKIASPSQTITISPSPTQSSTSNIV